MNGIGWSGHPQARLLLSPLLPRAAILSFCDQTAGVDPKRTHGINSVDFALCPKATSATALTIGEVGRKAEVKRVSKGS